LIARRRIALRRRIARRSGYCRLRFTCVERVDVVIVEEDLFHQLVLRKASVNQF
jgi:hypothetical protein